MSARLGSGTDGWLVLLPLGRVVYLLPSRTKSYEVQCLLMIGQTFGKPGVHAEFTHPSRHDRRLPLSTAYPR